ncbi:hypothetical protein KC343_g6075 [Hortaea werneckii]|uniref:Uncharacterized protein n=1 Tax=Hortaea werneckii TaxID=91943 RepID=A0A3M7FPZ6_HORWE|nr:hypothetical protein KC352_g25075 [Hortaea werneckii]KAI7565673.1 hypothetical protein KC317_g6205 [Hortaea werneckii]KAI7613630.1 hypothetical protein KC346_g7278 [Hortaea werneckii]KAI7627187.1 hypothetical protein KC343_g6075 [Hortaea werneckii]KAI7670160.1 hypothetical protein KC319_g5956 [Hortaea werneckii]
MPSEKPVASTNGTDEADLAKAFQELARGEQTASALEDQLTSMEARIEELLARAEREQQEAASGERQESNSSDGTHGAQTDTREPK